MSALLVAGDRVVLRPLEPGDAARLAAFTRDPDVRVALGIDRPLATDDEAELVRALAGAKDEIAFAVVARASGRIVGVCGLNGIAGSAPQMGIVVGDPQDRGKGFGGAAVRLLLRHAFDGLGLERVRLELLEGNTVALRAFEQAGFRRDDAAAQPGRIAMAITRAEWAALGESG